MEYTKRTNILFVDDMSVCCRIFMKGLSGKYEMYWAQTMEEAFNQMHNNKYDLVVTDVCLEKGELDLGGLDVVMEAYVGSIPVICISKENHKEQALDLGADRFIFKKEFFNNIEGVISDVLKNGGQKR